MHSINVDYSLLAFESGRLLSELSACGQGTEHAVHDLLRSHVTIVTHLIAAGSAVLIGCMRVAGVSQVEC